MDRGTPGIAVGCGPHGLEERVQTGGEVAEELSDPLRRDRSQRGRLVGGQLNAAISELEADAAARNQTPPTGG